MTRVHCKVEPFTHYAGRPKGNAAIGLGNPFPVAAYGREQCIRMFEEYARVDTKVQHLIWNLPADAVLGCWCHKHQSCHCDIIIKLWKEMHD